MTQPRRLTRLEIVTVGPNPNLQIVGSDPQGGNIDLGLWIGANNGATARTLRQTYVLASKSFGPGVRGTLVGFRQLLTIGTYVPAVPPNGSSDLGASYPLERPVESPIWKFVDGNVLWGVRRFRGEKGVNSPQNTTGFTKGFSRTPAQLFATFAGGLITPPIGGAFPGNILTPELSRFSDLRCERWNKPQACCVPFEGPCEIAMYASVQQTNPATRVGPPPLVVTDQFNGNNALPANSAVAHWIVVTTSGPNATIGQLLYDDGSGGGTATVVTAPVGLGIVSSQALTGGTITFNAFQSYVWYLGAATSTWVGASAQLLATQGTTVEDAFVQNYPGSTYFRIAGGLIFELEDNPAAHPPKPRTFEPIDPKHRKGPSTKPGTRKKGPR